METFVLLNILLVFFTSSASSFGGKEIVQAVQQYEKLSRAIRNSKQSNQGLERHGFSVEVMIANEGYPVETHEVLTDDCYILQMHRIPFGRHSPPVEGIKRPAVYLQHGLLCSSADWVMGTPEKFLGYILADAGYDVWMGNYRGNTYSRNHCDLNPNRKDFWSFSWDEMAQYDIPAMIDKILAETGHEQIHYVGHSMGTTAFMAMATERPEYNDKIIMANLLAPVAFMDHARSPITLISPFVDSVEWITDHLGSGEFLPDTWFMSLLSDMFCDENWLQPLCENVLFLLCGFDPAQVNETLLETIIDHTPAGASTHTILHYGQEVNSGGFHHYDFGRRQNEAHYGQSNPPKYHLANVKTPVSLYWGQNDWLAEPIDVQRLTDELPNIFDDYMIPYEKWNHLDYLWGIDADKYVYKKILENMERAEKEI